MIFIHLLTPKTLKGIWAAVQVPFNSDESIDYPCLKEEIDFLVQTSVHGIYSNGTAGEFYNQTEDEFDKISEMMAESCHRTGRPFQIGACHMSPVISLERIKRSRSLRPAAFQVILPDWLPTGPDEQVAFLMRMAEEAAPVPLMLYHPGHAKTRLYPADFKRLSDAIPGLIGIKVAAGGSGWYDDMRKLDLGISVFVPGHRLATGMNEGVGAGSYSNVACIDPDAALKWYSIIREDIEEGLRIEKIILAFFDRHILPLARQGYPDPALDKLLTALSGRVRIGTRLRWPYKGFDNKQVEEVRKSARKMLPDFFNLA